MGRKFVTRRAPGPGRIAMLAQLSGLRRDVLLYCRRAVKEYGDIVQLRIGPVRMFILNDPEAAHQVFVEKGRNYVKTFSARAVSRILGQGFITSHGELWRRQRRLIQPLFHRSILDGLVGTISSAVDSMLDGWAAAGTQQGGEAGAALRPRGGRNR